MDLKKLLEAELESEFELLKGIEPEQEGYRPTVDSVSKLMDRAIELKKLDIEIEDRAKKREEAKALAEFEKQMKLDMMKADRETAELEKKLKLAQMEEERTDRVIKNCLSAAGILLPIVVTIWGTVVSLKFEEEGTVTTIMGRGFVNKLLPKK